MQTEHHRDKSSKIRSQAALHNGKETHWIPHSYILPHLGFLLEKNSLKDEKNGNPKCSDKIHLLKKPLLPILFTFWSINTLYPISHYAYGLLLSFLDRESFLHPAYTKAKALKPLPQSGQTATTTAQYTHVHVQDPQDDLHCISSQYESITQMFSSLLLFLSNFFPF